MTDNPSEIGPRMAAVFSFSDLMWMHTVASRRRAFARSVIEWEEHDHMVELLCAGIAEHIVREEVDVGAYPKHEA